jgi:hypothetical protein
MFRPLRAILREIQQRHLYIYENYHTTAYPLFFQLFTRTVYVSYYLFIYLQSCNGNSFN